MLSKTFASFCRHPYLIHSIIEIWVKQAFRAKWFSSSSKLDLCFSRVSRCLGAHQSRRCWVACWRMYTASPSRAASCEGEEMSPSSVNCTTVAVTAQLAATLVWFRIWVEENKLRLLEDWVKIRWRDWKSILDKEKGRK